MCEQYKHCELTRPADDGIGHMISWIPERVAVVGNGVSLKDVETGRWTAGWRVVQVAEGLRSANVLRQRSRDYLRTRKALDA